MNRYFFLSLCHACNYIQPEWALQTPQAHANQDQNAAKNNFKQQRKSTKNNEKQLKQLSQSNPQTIIVHKKMLFSSFIIHVQHINYSS